MAARTRSPPRIYTGTQTLDAYDFNPTGSPGDLARIQIDNIGDALALSTNTGPKAFSISIWFSLRLHTLPSTLISYYITNSQTSVMRLTMEPDKLFFLHDYKITREYTMPHQFEPLKWYHVCLVVREISVSGNEVSSYSVALYFADSKEREFEFGGPFPMTGSICIGQDLSTVRKVSDVKESLLGRLSPSLYPEALFSVDVDALFQCSPLVRDPATLTWQSFGQVAGIQVDICKERSAKGVLIPQKLADKGQARTLCEMIDTDLAIPRTFEENRDFGRMLSLAPICRTGVLSRGWLGIVADAAKSSKAVVEWGALTSYISDQVNSQRLKTGDVILTSTTAWNTDTSVEACPLCYGHPNTPLTLFGFCDDDTGQSSVTFHPRTNKDGVLYFYSSGGLEIRKSNQWEIYDQNVREILATIDDDFFLGRKEWNMRHPISYCKMNREPEKMMSLSACLPSEFTCDNGQCIPMEYRCNNVYDCMDGNDEDCNFLEIPDNYEKRNLPPTRPLDMKFNLSLAKISTLDINAETLQVTTAFKMYWKDSRLGFNNLLDDTERNTFTRYLDDLWYPDIVMINEDSLSTPVDPQVDLLVMKSGKPKKIDQGYFYAGSENYLVYRIKKASYISCQFQLLKYPFDIQNCWVNMTLNNLPATMMNLEGNLETGIGDQILTDYEVSSITLDLNGNRISALISLQRLYGFHWLSTYIPTMLLHLLAYVSLHLNVNHFQARVFISIATLAMLIMLYAGTVSHLPRTSHLKFYDIWYFFSFVFLFFIIVVNLIASNLDGTTTVSKTGDMKLTKVQPLKSKGKEFPTLFIAEGDTKGGLAAAAKTTTKTSSSSSVDNDFILFIGMIVFPIIYFLFQLCYWIALLV